MTCFFGGNAREAFVWCEPRGAMSLVSLELDEKDKENFTELQQSMGQAQQELAQLSTKLRTRGAEAKHAELTLAELAEIADETRAYAQVGKMFLLQPLTELKSELEVKVDTCTKDVASLTEKRGHVEEAYKKVQEDFQEFVKAHVVETPSGEKKEEEKKE